jgi:hypothetical protein
MSQSVQQAQIPLKRKWDITTGTWGINRQFWPIDNGGKAPAKFTNCYFPKDSLLVAVDYSRRVCIAPNTDDREKFLKTTLGYQGFDHSLFSVKIPNPPMPWEKT